MQKTLIHCVVWTIAFVCFRTATATEKVDISKVITKADAEAVATAYRLKMRKAATKKTPTDFMIQSGVIMPSKGDKALVFDLVFGGKDAPPHLAATMFSALPAGGGKSTRR